MYHCQWYTADSRDCRRAIHDSQDLSRACVGRHEAGSTVDGERKRDIRPTLLATDRVMRFEGPIRTQLQPRRFGITRIDRWGSQRAAEPSQYGLSVPRVGDTEVAVGP